MKKANKILIFILAFALVLFTLTACTETVTPSTQEGGNPEITLVVSGDVVTRYTVKLTNLKSGGLVGVLEYLEQIDAIEYELNGTMLAKVGELENDAASNKWIYVYTTVEKDIDVSQYAQSVVYEGKTIVSSGIGAYEMTLEDGAIIYIGTIIYG